MMIKKSRRTVKLWLVTIIVAFFLIVEAVIIATVRTTDADKQEQEKTTQKTETDDHDHEHDH
ncbi:MAG: hypothetical protein ACOCWA_05100 [Bacteroidota bacterium]